MSNQSTRRDMLLAGAAATPANVQLAQAAQQVQAQTARSRQ
ncbi:hypothetical protein [Roseomonas alba]|nr:hypothetical protein [Neoroseomonas alba]